MPHRFSGYGSAAVGTDKTVLALLSGTTVRPCLYEFTLGSSSSPADVATLFLLGRFTAVGTEGSGFTPVPLDSADAPAAADYAVAHSGPPTYTASAHLWGCSLNQRATFRWVANPGGEHIAPATANNGIGLYSSSSGATPTYQCSMYHFE